MEERSHDPEGEDTEKEPRPPPRTRREPLPAQGPEPPDDDPERARRIRELLASPSYRVADRDVEFLDRDETRGVRLELDYLKTEHLLRAHDVEHTIVVFGGTRLLEPEKAEAAVREAREALSEDDEDEGLRLRLRAAERIRAKSRYYEVARAFGRRVGEAEGAARGGRLAIVTGGGPGIMEAANRGAHDADARSIGLNIRLPEEQYPNPYITPGLCFQFHYFGVRKLHFLLRARALVAFPGGYGTLDELFETLALVQTRTIEPVPVVLVGEEFWRRAVDVDFLVEEGVIAPEDRELFWFAETAEEIWNGILRWHELAGRPLCPAEPS
ncbi:MAG TPA: TIGR00730 family Rossman fold protein [Longimicrobiales bacterium]|nr:TIGR00730 family Rossman fold protein [Longimicrobiales bacterium]